MAGRRCHGPRTWKAARAGPQNRRTPPPGASARRAFASALLGRPGAALVVLAAALMALLVLATGASAWSTNQPAQGHKAMDSSGGATFNPVPEPGVATAVPLTDDVNCSTGTSAWINLPSGFDFQFFREDVTRVQINNNMFLVLNTPGSSWSCNDWNPSVRNLPSSATPNNIAAAYWRDMAPGTTSYWTAGTAPDRIFVIQFVEYVPLAESSTSVTLQVHLHEKDDAIEYHYINAAGTGTVGPAAVIGIEGCGGTRGLRVPGSAALSTNAYRFEPLMNTAPVADPDFYSVDEDDALSVLGSGVLQNDSDEFWCRQPIQAELVGEGPRYAQSFELQSDGRFTYTPDPGFYGVDSFTYLARDEDGAASQVQTVTITVDPRNDAPRFERGSDQEDVASGAPVAVDGWATSIDQGGPFTLEGEHACTPPDGNADCMDGLTVSTDGTLADPMQRLVFNTSFSSDDGLEFSQDPVVEPSEPTGPDAQGAYEGSPAPDGTHWGRLRFTPSTCGSATVSVALSDDAGTPADDGDDLAASPQSFNITVNCAPDAQDDSYDTTFETTLAVDDVDDGVLANDDDSDGDALTAVLVTEPENDASFYLNSDGTFQYVPEDGFSGTDTFTYKASDGTQDSAETTVTITVGEPPDEGPDAIDDAYETAFETTLVVTVDDGVLQNDTGQGLVAVLGTGPVHAVGTFELAADGSFSYTPEDGFYGVDSFTYVARDDADLTDTATVTITIAAPPPQVADPAQSVLTADPTSILADGDATSTITLAVMDEEGDPFVAEARILQLKTGDDHTCALVLGGRVYCWGSNEHGQLGDGTFVGSPAPVQVSGITDAIAITAGGAHTCALIDDGTQQGRGTMRCWGSNGNGQLGDGTFETRTTPVVVPDFADVVHIDAGIFHTCAVVAGGSAYCWGANIAGQVGPGLANWEPSPRPVDGITDAVELAAGFQFTCARRADMTVWCWGSNGFGQLGRDGGGGPPAPVDGVSGITAIAVGDTHACAIASDGGVFCWGRNHRGQLGDDTDGHRSTPALVPGAGDALAIAGGVYHTCAVTTDQAIRCWGANAHGQLGDGATEDRWVPVDVAGLAGAAAVSAGFFHTCAVRLDSTAACWGDNQNGQLGDGTHTDQHTPTDVQQIVPIHITIDTDHGTITSPVHQGGGLFTALLTCDEVGTATLTATIDGVDVADDATVQCLDPDDDPPTADDQTVEMVEDEGPRTITLTGSDPDGDPFTFELGGTPPAGLTGEPPDLTYAPAQDFCTPTPVSFQFRVRDGHGRTDTGTVTIDVTCVNDPPQAHDDHTMVEVDGSIAIDVLQNDSDADGPYGDTILLVAFDEGATSEAGGSISVVDGLVLYQAPPGFASPPDDSFSYTIVDSEGVPAVGAVHVTVEPPNAAPVATNSSAATQQDTTVDIALEATDDQDAVAALHYEVASPTSAGGLVTVTGDVAHYTPPSGTCGLSDKIKFTVTDTGGLTDDGHVRVVVECPHREEEHRGGGDSAPVLSPPRGPTRIEAVGGAHVLVQVTLPGDPPEGATLSYRQVEGPALEGRDWEAADGRLVFVAPTPQPGQTIVQTLHFTVTLGDHASRPLIVDVLTHRDDASPLAAASASATRTTPGQRVILDASASSHPLGLPMTFAWHQVSGTHIDLEESAQVAASFTVPGVPAGSQATLVFSVTVESQGRRDTAQVAVAVDGPAVGPVATPAARFEAVPRGDGTILFRAEGGDDAVYEWDFGDGKKAEGREVLHRFDQGGDFTVELRMDDEAGSDTATRKVTVAGLAPVSEGRSPVTLWVLLTAGGAPLLALLLVVALARKRRSG